MKNDLNFLFESEACVQTISKIFWVWKCLFCTYTQEELSSSETQRCEFDFARLFSPPLMLEVKSIIFNSWDTNLIIQSVIAVLVVKRVFM